MRALVAILLFAFAASASAQPALRVQRIERGALRVENVPETPPNVAERLSQYVNTRSASFQDWLPNGGVLILTRFGDTAQIHRVDRPLGDRTQLTFFDERVLSAVIRPGSNDILFARDVGGDENFAGYVLEAASGRARLVTEPHTRNESFIFSDDGRQIAWSYAPNPETDADIFIGDPNAAGVSRRLFDGVGAVSPLDFSAGGGKMLILKQTSIADSQLFILDVASGRDAPVTPQGTGAYEGGEFSPDGRYVYTISDANAQFPRLIRVNVRTHRPEVVSSEVAWGVEAFDLSDNGAAVAYVVNEAGRSTLHVMDARTLRAMPGPELPVGVISGVKFDHASRRIGFTLSTSTAPADVYSWDIRTNQLTRWTQSETGGMPQSTFVEPRLINWRSFDNREIAGYIYAPRTSGAHPVIINIHGGPESQFRPAFSAAIQYWVNELGAVVIAPNVRGSTGYGKTFLALDNGEHREDSVRDIGALLDWIATQPDLDRNRVIVYGGSYGGYMVLASMTHYNDRLAGAVDIVGISDWVTFLEHTSDYRRDLRRSEYGDERDPVMRAALERMSPLANIRTVTKPVFVIAGYNDPRVPYAEGEQLLSAIRANGGEAWFMMGMNEGHGFARRENQEAQREAETLFFRHVFAGP